MTSEAKKFVTQLTLTILNVNKQDFGMYECVAKNSLGQSDGTIRLSGELVKKSMKTITHR